MKKFVFVVLFCVVALGASKVDAKGRRRAAYGPMYSGAQYGDEVKTAQGIANIMARLRTVGHFGGNPGYEGCGSGASKEAAYNNCCFANSGMRTVDVGYAQDASGFWYCCRRYQ